MDKNIPHDEKNCKDTLQSTTNTDGVKNLGSFLQSIYHKWLMPLAYLKATLAMRHFSISFLFLNSFKVAKKITNVV